MNDRSLRAAADIARTYELQADLGDYVAGDDKAGRPGYDDAFGAVLADGLAFPLTADGYVDTDRYPPGGHDFPAVS